MGLRGSWWGYGTPMGLRDSYGGLWDSWWCYGTPMGGYGTPDGAPEIDKRQNFVVDWRTTCFIHRTRDSWNWQTTKFCSRLTNNMFLIRDSWTGTPEIDKRQNFVVDWRTTCFSHLCMVFRLQDSYGFHRIPHIPFVSHVFRIFWMLSAALLWGAMENWPPLNGCCVFVCWTLKKP